MKSSFSIAGAISQSPQYSLPERSKTVEVDDDDDDDQSERGGLGGGWYGGKGFGGTTAFVHSNTLLSVSLWG